MSSFGSNERGKSKFLRNSRRLCPFPNAYFADMLLTIMSIKEVFHRHFTIFAECKKISNGQKWSLTKAL